MSVDFTHDAPGTPAAAWRDHPQWAGLPDAAPLLGATTLDRVVVVAAHPDDESLGAAGLCSRAHHAGLEVHLVLVTAGEGSHPASPSTPPAELARRRRAESAAALHEVAPGATTTYVGIADGAVAASENDLTTRLVDLLGDARRTLLVAPWRADGHPDHQAAGRAAGIAARRTGATLLEYPIWFWHWAAPEDAPWDDLVAVRLTADELATKRSAVHCHATQVAPLSAAPGDEVLLTPEFLAHAHHDREVFVAQQPADPALDDLHRELADPWGVDVRWYEQRKRDLILAALPRRRFARGLEVGCSTGALTEALAERCDHLDAVDASAAAVDRARERLGHLPHVVVRQLEVPRGWPEGDGTLDLLVVSEVGYFLSPVDLDGTVERAAASLAPGGAVVLCHWRHPVVGWALDGAAVHRRFAETLGLPVAARYADRDVEILVLCAPDDLPDPQL